MFTGETFSLFDGLTKSIIVIPKFLNPCCLPSSFWQEENISHFSSGHLEAQFGEKISNNQVFFHDLNIHACLFIGVSC